MNILIAGILLLLLIGINTFTTVYAQDAEKTDCTDGTDSLPEISLSPNNRYVLATWYKFVRIWELETGTLINQIDTTAKRGIEGARFSPDSKSVLVTEADKAVMYDIESGREIRIFSNPNNETYFAARFSVDGEWVLWTGEENLEIFETKSGRKIAKIDGLQTQDFGTGSLSSTKTHFLHSTTDSMDRLIVQLWNVHNEEIIKSFPAQYGTFSPDGEYILLQAYGDNRDRLALWNIAEDRVIWSVPQYDYLDIGTFSPDGNHFITYQEHWLNTSMIYRSVYLWETGTGKLLYELGATGFLEPAKLPTKESDLMALHVEGAYFLSDSRSLVITGFSFVKLWDTLTKKIIRQVDDEVYVVIRVTSDGKYVVADYDNHIYLWNFETNTRILQYC